MPTNHLRFFIHVLTTLIHTLNSPSNPKLKASYLSGLCVNLMNNGGTQITIYRKPTHTDQNLNFTSRQKRSVVYTLTNRAKLYMTIPDDHQQAELQHMRDTLSYEEWSHHLNHTKWRKMTYVQVQGTSDILARIYLNLLYSEGLIVRRFQSP